MDVQVSNNANSSGLVSTAFGGFKPLSLKTSIQSSDRVRYSTFGEEDTHQVRGRYSPQDDEEKEGVPTDPYAEENEGMDQGGNLSVYELLIEDIHKGKDSHFQPNQKLNGQDDPSEVQTMTALRERKRAELQSTTMKVPRYTTFDSSNGGDMRKRKRKEIERRAAMNCQLGTSNGSKDLEEANHELATNEQDNDGLCSPVPRKRSSCDSESIESLVQQLTQTRAPTTAINMIQTNEGQNTEFNVDNQQLTMSREDKMEIFRQWLEMKQDDQFDPVVDLQAQTLQPEDLYEHFQEFLPYNSQMHDMKVQYERSCAERALKHVPYKSWLLRRSSYNRRFEGNFEVAPEATGGLATCLRMNNEYSAWKGLDYLRPSFYAFSWKKQDNRIGHLLFVRFGLNNSWAFASSSAKTGNIVLSAFFESFVDLLGYMLRNSGSMPRQVVLGYVSLEAFNRLSIDEVWGDVSG
jgi:hypothetical protein